MIRTLLIAALLGPGAALAGALEHACEAARFTGPTERYAHCVLGDCSEWSGLELTLDQSGSASGATTASVTLPSSRVFEDLAPRCAQMGPKGEMWIVVVESAQGEGAQLAAYALDETSNAPRLVKVAATPPIGRQNRWLAPVGIADFNGDGQLDVAYVDRPHLARVLRVVTPRGTRFEELASRPGHSNHRIGEDFISGGVRECGQGPEMITADAHWGEVLATRLEGPTLVPRSLGPFSGPTSLADALTCP